MFYRRSPIRPSVGMERYLWCSLASSLLSVLLMHACVLPSVGFSSVAGDTIWGRKLNLRPRTTLAAPHQTSKKRAALSRNSVHLGGNGGGGGAPPMVVGRPSWLGRIKIWVVVASPTHCMPNWGPAVDIDIKDLGAESGKREWPGEVKMYEAQ